MQVIDLQELMTKNSLTQRELAYNLGYSEEYISRILKGKNPINVKFISKVKEVYGHLDNQEPTGKTLPVDINTSLTDLHKKVDDIISMIQLQQMREITYKKPTTKKKAKSKP